MLLFTKLKQLEDMGIDSSYDLTELLINGVLPDGRTIDENTRNEYISVICGLVYETRNDIEHIKRILN